MHFLYWEPRGVRQTFDTRPCTAQPQQQCRGKTPETRRKNAGKAAPSKPRGRRQQAAKGMGSKAHDFPLPVPRGNRGSRGSPCVAVPYGATTTRNQAMRFGLSQKQPASGEKERQHQHQQGHVQSIHPSVAPANAASPASDRLKYSVFGVSGRQPEQVRPVAGWLYKKRTRAARTTSGIDKSCAACCQAA